MPGFDNVSLDDMPHLRNFINSDQFKELSELKLDILSLQSGWASEDYKRVFEIIVDSKILKLVGVNYKKNIIMIQILKPRILTL